MNQDEKYSQSKGTKKVNYEKIILALLQQCKDEGLTIEQAKFVLDTAKKEIDLAVSRSPIIF